MKTRQLIAQTVLWLFIFSSSLQLGAAMYETFVITPLWADSPPESVTGWNPVPQYAIDPGLFWGQASLLYAVVALAILIAAWFMPALSRKWALVAGSCSLLATLSTIFFFVPILQETIFTRGAGLSGAMISLKVHQWVNWNWVRMGLVFIGWVTGVRALGKLSSARDRA